MPLQLLHPDETAWEEYEKLGLKLSQPLPLLQQTLDDLELSPMGVFDFIRRGALPEEDCRFKELEGYYTASAIGWLSHGSSEKDCQPTENPPNRFHRGWESMYYGSNMLKGVDARYELYLATKLQCFDVVSVLFPILFYHSDCHT